MKCLASLRTGIIVVLFLGLIAAVDLLAPLDQAAQEIRFGWASRPASGDIVLVALDTETLSALGDWPLSRRHYADLVDTLLHAGAWDVFVDIDFSSASDASGDAALAAALERSGGYAWLAAFNQAGSDGSLVLTEPHPLFGQWANSFSVNVFTDGQGRPREVPLAIGGPDGAIPSMASVLNRKSNPGPLIPIDFGIDASTIPTFSMIDVLVGQVDLSQIAGKTVIVGASALELQDTLFAPAQGMLPGAAVHVLATETLVQERTLKRFGPLPAIGWLIAAIALVTSLADRRAPLPARIGLLVVFAGVGEAIALLAYLERAVILDTAVLHVGLAAVAMRFVWSESATMRRIASRLRGERDRMDAIFRRVITDNFDGILIISTQGKILGASAFARRWLGTELEGQDAATVLPAPLRTVVDQAMATTDGAPQHQGEVEMVWDGQQRHFDYVVTLSELTHTSSTAFICLTFRDVTKRRQQELHNRYLAEHDVLTGACSRTHFLEVVDSTPQQTALLVLNIDRITHIRATLGHDMADRVLVLAVERVREAGYTNIARIGGAQLAVALGVDIEPETAFSALAQGLTAPYELGTHRAIVGVSAGYAAATGSDANAEILLRKADTALTQAVARAGNRLVMFEPSMADRVTESRDLEQELRLALSRGEFELYYQGQFDLQSRAYIGAEALLRWNHPVRGMVGPGEFMPLAEETGFIVEMTRHILPIACKQATTWPLPIRVAVNISALHFELGDLEEDISDALLTSGLPPERLEIEITEGALLERQDHVIGVLERIAERGVSIAIDDFGTGYSSLSYLSRLPFHVLKIDKAFVDQLLGEPQSEAIVQTVIDLGRRLGKETLAEGVETDAQAERLVAMGCQSVQGFRFARPISAVAFSNALVSSRSSDDHNASERRNTL